MGKSSPKAPPPVDPNVVAAAQTQSNIATAEANARLNRINQVGPQGSVTYSQSGPAWDEQAYLAANPDVAAAIQSKAFKGSGADHYQQLGVNEGRKGVPQGYNPDEPWTQTTTLSPEQQRLYDLSTAAQTTYGETGLAQLGKLREQMSTPFQLQGAPDYHNVHWRSGQIQTGYDTGGPIQTGYDTGGAIQRSFGADDYSADRQRVEDALYARMNPSMEQSRMGLETRLRSQGLAPGSEAWTNAMRSQAQVETDARLGVVQAGGAEQSRLYGIDQARGQFANDAQAQQYAQNAGLAAFGNQAQAQQYGQNAGLAAFGNQAAGQQQNMDMAAGQYGQGLRQQMLAEQLAVRNQPLNETAALLTGQQVQNPQFAGVPGVQVANTDYMGAVGMNQQQQNANYQGQVATQNANSGAAAGVAGAAIGAGIIIA